jgi:hypothetical protein
MIGAHRWLHKRNPEGEDYLECERCQKQKDTVTINPQGFGGGV